VEGQFWTVFSFAGFRFVLQNFPFRLSQDARVHVFIPCMLFLTSLLLFRFAHKRRDFRLSMGICTPFIHNNVRRQAITKQRLADLSVILVQCLYGRLKFCSLVKTGAEIIDALVFRRNLHKLDC
jgi:hypothetical protein